MYFKRFLSFLLDFTKEILVKPMYLSDLRFSLDLEGGGGFVSTEWSKTLP